MMVVAFETSGAMVSVAVAGPEGEIRERSYPGLGQVATTLMPTLLALCEETGLTLRDCQLVGLSLGPGSFTGLRVGVAAANALAVALDCRVIGVSSLEVTANAASTEQEVHLCLSPHRRGSFYGQLFRRSGSAWVASSQIEVGSVMQIVAATGITRGAICGPEESREDWLRRPKRKAAGIPFVLTYPSARVLVGLARERAAQPLPRFAVPLYVRASQPEEKEKAARQRKPV